MRNTLKVLKDVETRKSLVAKAIRDGNVSVKDFMSLQEQYAFVYKDHSGNSALGMGRSGSANLSGSTNDYIQFIITTLEEDRDGDIVVPMGRVGKNYANNPVWFFGHQEWEIPIGTSRAPDGSIAVVSQRDKCISNFYPDRADPDAMFVFGKVQRGILNATSIAFVPLIAQRREEMYKSNPRDTRPSGWRFDSWDHTETSIVGVPANAGAIRDSLDKEKSFITPRLQKALKPYAAKSRKEQGIVWSGWCPNGDCTVKKAAKKDCGCKSKAVTKGKKLSVGMHVEGHYSVPGLGESDFKGRITGIHNDTAGGNFGQATVQLDTPIKLGNSTRERILLMVDPKGFFENDNYRQLKSLAESSGTSGGYLVPITWVVEYSPNNDMSGDTKKIEVSAVSEREARNAAASKVGGKIIGLSRKSINKNYGMVYMGRDRGLYGEACKIVEERPNGKVIIEIDTGDRYEVRREEVKVDKQKSVPPCECGGKLDCPCGNKKSVSKSEYTEMSDAKLKKEAERVRAELDRERDAAWAKHGSHVGAGDLIRLEGPQSNLAKLSSKYNLLVHEAKTNRGLTLKELAVKKKTPVKQPVAKSKSVRKADMDEEDQVMKDDAHDLIAEDIEMEEPFTVKPSAASIVKTYQHAKAEAEFLEDEIAKLDHPGIEEGLTKYKAKYVDPRMEHLKGMLHTHHAKGEGDPDEFLDKCMKGMETDGTGGSETDPGEEGMVQAGEIPPEDEVVSKRRKSVRKESRREIKVRILPALATPGKFMIASASTGQLLQGFPKYFNSEEEARDYLRSHPGGEFGYYAETKDLEDDNISEEVEDKDLDLVEWAEQEEAEPEHSPTKSTGVKRDSKVTWMGQQWIVLDLDDGADEAVLVSVNDPDKSVIVTLRNGQVVGKKSLAQHKQEEEVIDEEVGINPDEDTEEILERYQHPKNLKWYTRKVGTAKRVGNKLVLVKEAEFLEEEEEVKSLEEDNISEEVMDKDATEEIVEEKAEDDLSPEDMERLKQLTNRLKDYGFAI